MNRLLPRLPLVYAASTFVVLVLSWVGHVYEWGLNNLLCADGFRWWVANVVDNFTDSPLGEIMLLLICLSVLSESGALSYWKSGRSIKQKRAIGVTSIALGIYVVAILFLLFSSHSVLLNAFGTLGESPFQEGAYGLVLIGGILVGNLYGYFSGTISSFKDFVSVHTCLISKVSHYFLTLFVASQFMACLSYVFEVDDATMAFLEFVVYYVPLFLHLVDLYITSVRKTN